MLGMLITIGTSFSIEAACHPIALEVLENIEILDISFVKSETFVEGLDVKGRLQNTNPESIKHLRIDLHPAHSDTIKLFHGHHRAVDITNENGVDLYPQIPAGEIFLFQEHIIPYFRAKVNNKMGRFETGQVIITFGASHCSAPVDKEKLSFTVTIPTKTVTRSVQSKLDELGYEVGTVDGIWGNKTKTAIKQFQQNQQLKVTGALDNPTLAALGLQ